MEARAKAFETDDYALRCYIDQLPVDRCLFCAIATAPRDIHVAGPVHRWTNLHELADSDSVGNKLLVAGAMLSRGHVGVRARKQQTKGFVSMAVCARCAPTPNKALLVTGALVLATIGLAVAHQILFAVVAGLAALGALGIAVKRMKLSVGEIDEDDFMFKIHGVDDGVKAEVLALGAEPHPANRSHARFEA